MNFDQQLTSLQAELATEEERGGCSGISDILERQARRCAIRTQLARLRSVLHHESARFDQLSPLPDLGCIRWAQHVLASPASRLLVLDTVFPAESATLVQVLLLDMDGQVRLHRCVATDVPLDPVDLTRLGLSQKDRQEAVPVPHLWPEFLDALHGCYLLASDWRHARTVLEREAQHYQLEPPVLIGEDLLPWLARYYQASGVIGLASLCQVIGYPLPAHPTAYEHGCGQLALLQAMAQGITCAYPLEAQRDYEHTEERPSASLPFEIQQEDLS